MLHVALLCASLLAAQAVDPASTTSDLKMYEALKAKAGKDASAQVKVALWCEAHGMDAERVKHLAQAVLSDPRNVTARGLLGLIASGGRWETAERARERIKADETLSANLAEYERRRSRLTADEIHSRRALESLEEKGGHEAAYAFRLKSDRRLAQAHVELGLWCQTQGLKPEATAHFSMAVQLDPSRESRWKLLGYVRRNGRWQSPEQADADDREAREQKQADRYWEPLLKKWTAWLGEKRHREEAEGLLATVTDPRAVPSILRLFPVDRSEPNQLRRVRLLAQIDDPKSSLAIADQAVRTRSVPVRREAIEILRTRPSRDYAGKLVEMIHGLVRYQVQPVTGPDSRGAIAIEAPRFRMLRTYDVPPAFELAPTFRGYAGYNDNGRPFVARGVDLEEIQRYSGNPDVVTAKVREIEVRTANMLVQAAQAALFQMALDIRDIENANNQAHEYNASIIPVLESAAGAPSGLGDDEDAWRGWWFDRLGYNYQSSPKPTITQEVVTQYEPYTMYTCFAAGTSIHTLDGARTIESIQVGDQVLSQDDSTGALSFQPVVFVHRNPPGKTLRIKLSDGQSIVSSVFHRFWRAHLGWAMARELKPGETLRTLSGTVRIESIGSDAFQPLYNLDVAGAKTFFAGPTDLLVHDNTLPDHRLKPFDALPVVDVSPRPE
ncbi:MAG: polymorphic toxin-type HINT domain-containing protein [Isosphaeraceae bacterium]